MSVLHVGAEPLAEDWRHAEHGKEVRRDHVAHDAFGAIVEREAETIGACYDDAHEDVGLSKMPNQRAGRDVGPAVRAGQGELDQAAGIGDRQRLP